MQDLTVSIVQTKVFWGDVSANLKHLESIISDYKTSDLIVLSETFNTGFDMNPSGCAESMEGKTVTWMKQQASLLQTAICGSVIIEEDSNYFNRFILVYPSGKTSHYDKRHAFSMAGEDKVFQKGDSQVIWEINDWKINPLVCYDLRFPVWSRNTNDYDLLLYTANWPAKRIHHWTRLIQARAIENQCFVAACNRIGSDNNDIVYNGNSCFVDFDGEYLQTPSEEDVVISHTFSKAALKERRSQFPVLNDKDSFTIY